MNVLLNHVPVSNEDKFRELYEWAMALRGGVVGVARKVVSAAAEAAFKWALKARQNEEIFNRTCAELRHNRGQCMSALSRRGHVIGRITFRFFHGSQSARITNRLLVRAMHPGFLVISVMGPTGLTLREVKSRRGFAERRDNRWFLPFTPGHSQYTPPDRNAHRSHLLSKWLPKGV